MKMSIGKVMFVVAAGCFLLALFSVSFGSINLTNLGLLFLALGFIF
jgi:hypothetical protein